nr:hypothetical protein 7 [bacterium]
MTWQKSENQNAAMRSAGANRRIRARTLGRAPGAVAAIAVNQNDAEPDQRHTKLSRENR